MSKENEAKALEWHISFIGDIGDGSDRIVASGPWRRPKEFPFDVIRVVEYSALEAAQAEAARWETLHDAVDAAHDITRARESELLNLVKAARDSFKILSEHNPVWADDFLRARNAVENIDATLKRLGVTE